MSDGAILKFRQLSNLRRIIFYCCFRYSCDFL